MDCRQTLLKDVKVFRTIVTMDCDELGTYDLNQLRMQKRLEVNDVDDIYFVNK